MGSWGPGAFDNDTAADHLSSVVAKWIAGKQPWVGVTLPDDAKLERWKLRRLNAANAKR